MDQGEQRRVRLENWAAMAAGWEQAREEREQIAAPVTDWLVRELSPRPGDVVLELAAGQGDVGFAVAALLGAMFYLRSTSQTWPEPFHFASLLMVAAMTMFSLCGSVTMVNAAASLLMNCSAL